MVEKWKLALKEFLKNYEEDDDVVGAILCGSYASGNYNSYSDIDVCLVLKDEADYEERGNTDSNSYLIEYFMNPKWKFKEYMNKQYSIGNMPLINMFAYGKIIYDLDGSVKELQNLALDYIDKPLLSVTTRKLESTNYSLWDLQDELKNSLDYDSEEFMMIYYDLLYKIYEAYCDYEQMPKYPKTKLYKILTDESYRRRYHAFKIPGDEFVKLYIKCYEKNRKDIMYKSIINLLEFYYGKQGGFNIRTFKLRTENIKEEE